MKGFFLIIGLSIVIGPSAVEGALFTEGKPSLTIKYKQSYNSNLLLYSPRDRGRFLNGTEAHPSSIKTLDDLRTDLRAVAGLNYRLFGRHRGRATLQLNFSHFLQNPLKNAGLISLSLKQDLTGKWSMLLYYLFEPHYYLRDYIDVNTRLRQHCEFALDKWIGKVYFQPRRFVEIIGRFEYKRYAYSKYFTEYDGDLNSLGSEVVFRRGTWRVSCSYMLNRFDNLGFSSSDPLPPGDYNEDTETGDSDYQEDQYALSVRRSFKLLGRRSALKFEQSIADRYYSTAQSPDLDPIHHGRRDIVLKTSISGTVALSRKVDIELGVEFKRRDSEASAPIVSEIKDYCRWIGWVQFGCKLF